MKNILLILALFLTSFLNAQNSIRITPSPENQPIIDFIRNNTTKKVGDGVCGTFVDAAMQQKIPNWTYSVLWEPEADEHEINSVDSIQPGDVIYFEFKGSETAHIGIVTRIYGNVIWYANQNVSSGDDLYKTIDYKGRKSEVFAFSRVRHDFINASDCPGTDIWVYRY